MSLCLAKTPSRACVDVFFNKQMVSAASEEFISILPPELLLSLAPAFSVLAFTLQV